MSSHREAPEISKDPVCDSTDVYAFISPDNPTTTTLIANYIPFERPDGGPNYYEFGDDVQYYIHVDNDGDGKPNLSFLFTFTTTNTIPASFLYNDGPIESLTDPNWNRRQTYNLDLVTNYGQSTTTTTNLASNVSSPPCNIGPLSTPNYATLAADAVFKANQGITVFAGQRADGFVVDLGAVFDLANLRPFETAHYQYGLANTGFTAGALGVNSLDTVNVHTLALQIPTKLLTPTAPTSTTDPRAVIGVWTAAYRQKVKVYEKATSTSATGSTQKNTGPYVQVSRLGNPLFNELLNPIPSKDIWNASEPQNDKDYLTNVSNPLLAQLLPVLYSSDGKGANSVFPNLEAYNAGSPNRADLVAVLLTGIPATVVSATFSTYDGGAKPVYADKLRLNTLIPPTQTTASTFSILGVIGGDLAGFPNGRRVYDDVATIEIRAVAGVILPLVDPNFTADAAAGAVTDVSTKSTDITYNGTEAYLSAFPYLGTPHEGFLLFTGVPVTSGPRQ